MSICYKSNFNATPIKSKAAPGIETLKILSKIPLCGSSVTSSVESATVSDPPVPPVDVSSSSTGVGVGVEVGSTDVPLEAIVMTEVPLALQLIIFVASISSFITSEDSFTVSSQKYSTVVVPSFNALKVIVEYVPVPVFVVAGSST